MEQAAAAATARPSRGTVRVRHFGAAPDQMLLVHCPWSHGILFSVAGFE